MGLGKIFFVGVLSTACSMFSSSGCSRNSGKQTSAQQESAETTDAVNLVKHSVHIISKDRGENIIVDGKQESGHERVAASTTLYQNAFLKAHPKIDIHVFHESQIMPAKEYAKVILKCFPDTDIRIIISTETVEDESVRDGRGILVYNFESSSSGGYQK